MPMRERAIDPPRFLKKMVWYLHKNNPLANPPPKF